MNTNPFQDPAVLNARTPNASMALDPSQANKMSPMPVHPSPYANVSGSMSPAPHQQQQVPFGVPMTGKHHGNLMDEIGNSIKATNSSTVMKVMRTVNILLSVATIVAGVLAWISGHVDSFQKIIAGSYIILFGCLLLAFEMRTDKIDQIFRVNFGFMYGNKTRTIFLLFMAIWPLSMGNFWITIVDAALLFVNAFFNYFVISQHPAFSHGAGGMSVEPQHQGMGGGPLNV